MSLERSPILAEQENGAAVPLAEKVLPDVLAGGVLEFNVCNMLG